MGNLPGLALSRPALQTHLCDAARICPRAVSSLHQSLAAGALSSRLISREASSSGASTAKLFKDQFIRLRPASQQRGFSVAAMSDNNSKKLDLTQEVAFYPEKTIKVSASSGKTNGWKGDLLAVGIYEDQLDTAGDAVTLKDSSIDELDADLKEIITELIQRSDFKGKQGSSSFARLKGNALFVGIVGLGNKAAAAKPAEWGISAFQAFGAAIAAAAKTHKAKTAAAAVAGAEKLDSAAIEKIAIGALTGAYEAVRFKNKATLSPLETVDILAGENTDSAAAVDRAAAFARGVTLAKYLVEAPPNICTPTHIAKAAQGIADSAPDVMKIDILEEEDCRKLGMGCFLGVAACSAEPPKFIHLTYTPEGGFDRVIGLVGKGLTFDSGGYNLKVGGMIEMMKFDMGGAGAVLGAAQILADVKPKGVQVHIITASCENMIDGKGMRPGDILQAANGKTVEVNNTDAEGRLTLADALWFAQEKCGVQAVVDIATLTGACAVALGGQVGGMFTPDCSMADALTDASRASGEKLWRLPMEDAYWEQMKSAIADMKNTGGRQGGAITAALFLREYVDTEKVQWAHVDIAGPAWDEKAGGATGFGAATLAEWAIAQGRS